MAGYRSVTMRATRVIAGAALLLLSLAACGEAAQSVPPVGSLPPGAEPQITLGAPPSSGGTVVEPTEPKKPPYPTGVPLPSGTPEVAQLLPASQVDTTGIPSSFNDHGVYQVNVYSRNGGRTLQITASASDACTRLQARVVDQTQDAVRINLGPVDVPQGGRPDEPGGGMCAQVLTPQTFTVDLKVPLGNRTVFLAAAP
jgi:hypothetical protein